MQYALKEWDKSENNDNTENITSNKIFILHQII